MSSPMCCHLCISYLCFNILPFSHNTPCMPRVGGIAFKLKLFKLYDELRFQVEMITALLVTEMMSKYNLIFLSLIS